MKLLLLSLLAPLLLALPAQAVELAANAKVLLSFPELPNTLAGQAKGRPETARLGAILPSNYSLQSNHPLFVYLKGGSGGPDDGGAMAREIVGDRDFIAVQLPLFKRVQSPGRILPVTLADYGVTSAAYRVMLTKLSQTIPNIDWKRSVIGGHSNGAHALSVLLASQDPFITEHFRSYWFHEGGFALLPACLEGKDCRYLTLLADDGMTGGSGFRSLMLEQITRIERQAKLVGIDFQNVTMRGYGHDVPPEYMWNVRQFARTEPLEDIPASHAAAKSKLAFPLKSHPDTRSWNDLLVGDLTNAKYSSQSWHYRDGTLVAAKDSILWTKAIQSDYILDFEFLLQPGGGGGIILAGKDRADSASVLPIIRLGDESAETEKTPAQRLQNSSLTGIQTQVDSSLKPPKQWNRMTVVVRQPVISVILNDRVVDTVNFSRIAVASNPSKDEQVSAEASQKPFIQLDAGQVGLVGGVIPDGISYRALKLLRLEDSRSDTAPERRLPAWQR